MAKARTYLWTVDDFLAFEAEELERYEFVGGVVRMATGGTAAHSAIKGNVVLALDEASTRTVSRPSLRSEGPDPDRGPVSGCAGDLPAAGT